MSDTNSRDLFDPLSRGASEYAKKCSELSDLLVRVQKFLRDTPGKMAIKYDTNQGCLKFCRYGSTWQLVYSASPHETVQITSASVDLKIKAAQLLPGLFKVLRKAQEAKLLEVSHAIDTLREFPFIGSKDAKEGKS